MHETTPQHPTIVDAIRNSGMVTSDMDRYLQESQRVIQEGIIDNVPRIDVKVFLDNHLISMLSDDDDESNYAMKQLASEVGGFGIPFEIWDVRTKEKLFRIPSVTVSFNTVTTLQTSGAIITRFRESQLASFPGQVEAFGEYYRSEAARAMGLADARERFHHGWLEVTDFCGILTDKEEEFYARYRDIKNQLARNKEKGSYEFWVNPMPMDEYLAKHGGIMASHKRRVINAEGKLEFYTPSEKQKHRKLMQTKQDAYESTDDWS